jgi:replication-associated recombination protein RarA
MPTRAPRRTIDEMVGQDELLGAESTIRILLSRDSLPSLILWGPVRLCVCV